MLYLAMQIEGTRYVLDIASVAEILPWVTLQELPRAPHGIAGIIDYGGEPVPVVDLSVLLANRPAHRRFNTRIVMVRFAMGTGTRLLGLIAERATETMRREPSDFRDPQVQSTSAPHVWPVALDADGPVYCMDLNRLLPESISGSLTRQAVNA